MDLRTVKTQKGIREAFLMLRAGTPLAKIKVNSICAQALVNKTTFYKHYPDVFALGKELETEAAALLVDRLRAKDCLFTQPQEFVEELVQGLETHRTLLATLFRDQPDALFTQMTERFSAYYEKSHPQPAQQRLALTFAIGGLLRALQVLALAQDIPNADKTAQVTALLRRFGPL